MLLRKLFQKTFWKHFLSFTRVIRIHTGTTEQFFWRRKWSPSICCIHICNNEPCNLLTLVTLCCSSFSNLPWNPRFTVKHLTLTAVARRRSSCRTYLSLDVSQDSENNPTFCTPTELRNHVVASNGPAQSAQARIRFATSSFDRGSGSDRFWIQFRGKKTNNSLVCLYVLKKGMIITATPSSEQSILTLKA